MEINEILKVLYKESHLLKGCFMGTDVFFYLSGRYPELTIGQAVDVVKLAREKVEVENEAE